MQPEALALGLGEGFNVGLPSAVAVWERIGLPEELGQALVLRVRVCAEEGVWR